MKPSKACGGLPGSQGWRFPSSDRPWNMNRGERKFFAVAELAYEESRFHLAPSTPDSLLALDNLFDRLVTCGHHPGAAHRSDKA
ncbi:MAG: hypothetical protein ABJA61_04085 [Caldimonas sp.]